MVFSVRVQARARKDEVVGELDGVLKVRLQAPAIEGRANEALVDFLAGVLTPDRFRPNISKECSACFNGCAIQKLTG